MPDLQPQFRYLRKRAVTALCLHGVSCTVLLLLTAVTLIGFCDWWIQLNSDVLRLCLGLSVLAATGIFIWRLLVQPLRDRLSDLALAMRIERRYPGFRDGLASTVQFAESGADPSLGSPELQQKVIDQTLADLQSVPLNDVVETQRVRRTTWMAVGVCLFVALVAGLRPADASLALNRLIFPFSAADWPRQHDLQLLDRELRPITQERFRRVRGDTFKFYVQDQRAALPDDVRVLLHYGDGETRVETLRQVSIRDADGHVRALCVANILLERGPIRFEVVGGDDDTLPEYRIDVLPPPQLEALNVEITPPAYSRRPAQKLPVGIGHFEALVGSQVRITARTNKSLKAARLRVKNRTIPGTKLSRNGRELRAEFRVVEAGNYSYRFELQDREGFENAHAIAYDIKAVSDRVPVVRLVRPADNIRATADAAIPVQLLVEDDLEIRSVTLKYAFDRDPQGSYRTLPLLKPVERKDVPTELLDKLRTHSQSFNWPLKDVSPGTQVRFFVEASDQFNLDGSSQPSPLVRGHVGRSQVRVITIVTPADKRADLAGRYNELLEDLTRIQRLQRRAHGQLAAIRVQLQKTGGLRDNEDLPVLRRVVQDQSDVGHQLVGGDQSIISRARSCLAELRANRLQAPLLSRRLNRIVHELDALRTNELHTVLTDLREVETSSRAGDPGAKKRMPITKQRRRQRLDAAEATQARILDSLRDLIGELTEWRNWHNLSGELRELIRDQSAVRTAVARLQADTLGKPLDELTPQQRADLARSSEQQRRNSEQLGRFRASLRKYLRNLKQPSGRDRNARDTLNDADAFLRDHDVVQRMSAAADRIAQNRFGTMAATQKELAGDMQTLLGILENRGTADLKTLIARQKQAEEQLQKLQDKQEELLEQLRKLDDRTPQAERDRIAQELQMLRKRTETMARMLRRRSAPNSARTTQGAADSMRDAARAAQRGSLQQAARDQQDAIDKIKQARRQLAQARRQNETQLAAQALERLAGDLRGLLLRQTNVIKETARLKGLVDKARRDKTRPWTRGRLITLDTQREEQDRLAGRIRELAKSTADAAILSLALDSTAKAMSSAVKSLAASREDTDQLAEALASEQSAKRQLEQLAKSLMPERTNNATPMPAGDGGEQGTRVAGPHVTAQFKLLKVMQDALNDETREFDKRRMGDVPLKPAQQRDLDRLTERQEKLRDLSRDLMRKLGIRPQPKPKDAKPDEPPKPAQLVRDVVTRMKSTADRLMNGKTGKPTQDDQQRISDDLKKLIAAAAAAGNAGQSTASNPDNGSRNGGNNTKKPGNGNKTKKKSDGSDPGVRNPAETRKVILAERKRLIEEVWGHLPESVKQRLQNMPGESYLPKYKPLIKRYFESLAQ